MRRRAPSSPTSRRCSSTWWPVAAGVRSAPAASATTSGPAGPDRTPSICWRRDAMRSARDVERIRPAALFDAWLFAEADATSARRLASAASSDKAAAYAIYRAALDREAHAARMLELRLAAA